MGKSGHLKEAEPKPGILDAVRDQNGACWLQYGDDERATWFALSELISTGQGSIFKRLIDIDPRFATPSFQNAFRELVGTHEEFRPALVGAMPGWLESAYVRGDGELVKAPKDRRKLIVAFEPYQKFRHQGSLREWQNAIEPFVENQPLALFALSLGFVGFLLRYFPPGNLNPLFEIAGEPGTGKSTLGLLMMSVTAGNSLSAHGGGNSWNITPALVDVLKRMHRDGPMLFDEGNLAEMDEKKRQELIAHAAFSLSSTEERLRFGEDEVKPNSFIAFLSTTNEPLDTIVKSNAATKDALLQRMITIQVSKGGIYGVFSHLPKDFDESDRAIDELHAATKRFWGSAGRRFVKKIVCCIAEDESAFRQRLSDDIEKQRGKLKLITDVPRIQKNLALVMVAGRLAQRWGILPKRWGRISSNLLIVAEQNVAKASAKTHESKDLVRQYVLANRHRFVMVSKPRPPCNEAKFDATVGFIRRHKGETRLFISSKLMPNQFPQYRRIMQDLRNQGLAKTETGSHPKLNIKVPADISDSGRAYCIRLINDLADLANLFEVTQS